MKRTALIFVFFIVIVALAHVAPTAVFGAHIIWIGFIFARRAADSFSKAEFREEGFTADEDDGDAAEDAHTAQATMDAGNFNGYGATADSDESESEKPDTGGGTGFRGDYWTDAPITGRDALRPDIPRPLDNVQASVKRGDVVAPVKLHDSDHVTGMYGERGIGATSKNTSAVEGDPEPDFDMDLYTGNKKHTDVYANMTNDGDGLIASRAKYAGVQAQASQVIRAQFNKYSMQPYEEGQLQNLSNMQWWNSEHLDREF